MLLPRMRRTEGRGVQGVFLPRSVSLLHSARYPFICYVQLSSHVGVIKDSPIGNFYLEIIIQGLHQIVFVKDRSSSQD